MTSATLLIRIVFFFLMIVLVVQSWAFHSCARLSSFRSVQRTRLHGKSKEESNDGAGAAHQSAMSGREPTSDVGSGSASEISSVQAAIDEVDEEIRQVNKEIHQIETIINACSDPEGKKSLFREKEQLRREKEQLREKELLLLKQLGDEKLLLLKDRAAAEQSDQQRTDEARAWQEQMRQFVECCRCGREHEVTLSPSSLPASASEITARAAEGGIVRVKIGLEDGLGDGVLEALVLPFGWPLFGVSKQDNALGKTMCFHRLRISNAVRIEETLQRLRNREQVAWVGAPGIGKSAGMNYVLMELLRHLGEDGWPAMVGLRVENHLVTFALEPAEGTVRIEVVECSYENILSKSAYIKKKNGVLLVELLEGEKELRSKSSLFFTLSSRDVDSDFKELDKSGIAWLIADPWNERELRSAALCMYALGAGEESFPQVSSVEQLMALIKSRTEEVGGLPRFVLAKEEQYKGRSSNQKTVYAEGLYESMHRRSLFDVHGNAKYFIAPMLNDDFGRDDSTNVINSNWYYGFLSTERALAAFHLCERFPEMLKALQQYGVEYQMKECLVELAIRRDPSLADHYSIDKWRWYRDIDNKLCLMNDEEASALKDIFKCTRIVITFNGPMLYHDVRMLDERAVYKSTSSQMVAGEFLVVSHSAKMCFLIQVSDRTPQNHSFKERNLREIATALQLRTKAGSADSEYKLALVYVMDSKNSVPPKGAKIIHVDGQAISLQDVRQRLEMEFFFVLANIDPSPSIKSEITYLAADENTDVFVKQLQSKKAFHFDQQCRHLKGCSITIKLKDAEARGLTPCKQCIRSLNKLQ